MKQYQICFSNISQWPSNYYSPHMKETFQNSIMQNHLCANIRQWLMGWNRVHMTARRFSLCPKLTSSWCHLHGGIALGNKHDTILQSLGDMTVSANCYIQCTRRFKTMNVSLNKCFSNKVLDAQVTQQQVSLFADIHFDHCDNEINYINYPKNKPITINHLHGNKWPFFHSIFKCFAMLHKYNSDNYQVLLLKGSYKLYIYKNWMFVKGKAN